MIKCFYSVTCDIVRLVISEVTKLSSGSDGRNRDRASRGWCSDKVRHTLFRNKFMTCNPSVRRHWVFDKKTSNPSWYWKIHRNKKHARYKLTITNFGTLVSCTPATNWPPASKNHRKLGQAASCGKDGAATRRANKSCRTSKLGAQPHQSGRLGVWRTDRRLAG